MGGEHITVPARFLVTMAHLIVTLTIVYDVDAISRDAKGAEDDTSASKDRLTALAWTSLVCFLIEIAGIFSGVSLFLPTVCSFYILLHFIGTILVLLFVALHWEVPTFTFLFIFFSGLPAVLEMMVAFGVLKLKLMEYS
mmetsp:Transcript_11671/g.15860  ORF Transcript_11671/g.15860 Transcript_11671/m.15860 type:complete len:139 (-) Transcript_11671:112-528(-)